MSRIEGEPMYTVFDKNRRESHSLKNWGRWNKRPGAYIENIFKCNRNYHSFKYPRKSFSPSQPMMGKESRKEGLSKSTKKSRTNNRCVNSIVPINLYAMSIKKRKKKGVNQLRNSPSPERFGQLSGGRKFIHFSKKKS